MKRILSPTEALARLRANRAAASVAATLNPAADVVSAMANATVATEVPTYKATPVAPNAAVQGDTDNSVWIVLGVGTVLLVSTGMLIWWLNEREEKKQQQNQR